MVEDSSFDRKWVTRELEQCRFDFCLHYAAELAQAAELCAGAREFDLVLLDLNLPDSLGLDTLREMLAIGTSVPIVVLTGDGREETATAAADMGAQDFLVKEKNVGNLLRKAILFAVSRQRATNILKQNIAVLSAAASLDPLTGLYNRRKLDEAAADAWNEFQANDIPCTCLLFDLDHFGNINNENGHIAGDAILRSTAITLSSRARAQDIVTRYGGEEFCILLPNTPLRDGWRLAERIRLCIEEDRVKTETGVIRVTASCGVAEITPEMKSPQELIDAADQALYKAKENRNCVVTSEELVPLESILSK